MSGMETDAVAARSSHITVRRFASAAEAKDLGDIEGME
jgi:hypothetical protein